MLLLEINCTVQSSTVHSLTNQMQTTQLESNNAEEFVKL